MIVNQLTDSKTGRVRNFHISWCRAKELRHFTRFALTHEKVDKRTGDSLMIFFERAFLYENNTE